MDSRPTKVRIDLNRIGGEIDPSQSSPPPAIGTIKVLAWSTTSVHLKVQSKSDPDRFESSESAGEQ